MLLFNAVQYTDAQLVEKYQTEGNASALTELVNRYYKNVKGYCYTLVRNRDDAEDLTSDVFLKVIRHLPRLQNPCTFPAWLFRIARNTCMSQLKKHSQNPIIPLNDAIATYQMEDSHLDESSQKEKAFDAMQLAMTKIPVKTRELLEAKYYRGNSMEEIMSTYGLSESAAKMRLLRARNLAKKIFEEVA